MSKIVYFIRHGQSEANLANTIAGSQIDSPLTDLGKQQAMETAAKVSEVAFDLAVSSPLSRAKDTACIILNELNLDHLQVNQQTAFTERDAKEYTGTDTSEYFKLVESGMYSGESPQAMRERVLRGLRWLNDQSFECALVATHNGTIRAISTIVDKLPPEDFSKVPVLQNGETLKVDLSKLDLI